MSKFKPTKKEIEEFKYRREFDKEKWRRISQTKECKIQANLFRSWVALCEITYTKIKNGEGYFWCPFCREWEKLKFECGLSIEDAIELLKQEIPKHAEEVKRVRKQIEKEMENEQNGI